MNVKLAAHKALVRPCLDYASCLWKLYSEENLVKLKKVQKPAARFIYNNYKCTHSVTEMIDYLGLDTLKARHAECRSKYLYLIL